MEFLSGVLLAVAVGVFAKAVGFDRDRAFYPTLVAVIASYDVLFAAMVRPRTWRHALRSLTGSGRRLREFVAAALADGAA